MYERFSDRARKILQFANMEAQKANVEHLGIDHIAVGLLKEGSGMACAYLRALGIDVEAACGDLRGKLFVGPDMVTMGKLPQTPMARRVIECAILEAKNLCQNYVGSEHLLMGILSIPDCTPTAYFMQRGVTREKIREWCVKQMNAWKKEGTPDDPWIKFMNDLNTAVKHVVDAEVNKEIDAILALLPQMGTVGNFPHFMEAHINAVKARKRGQPAPQAGTSSRSAKMWNITLEVPLNKPGFE